MISTSFTLEELHYLASLKHCDKDLYPARYSHDDCSHNDWHKSSYNYTLSLHNTLWSTVLVPTNEAVYSMNEHLFRIKVYDPWSGLKEYIHELDLLGLAPTPRL